MDTNDNSNKQRHFDRADIIERYGEAFQKWKWFILVIMGIATKVVIWALG